MQVFVWEMMLTLNHWSLEKLRIQNQSDEGLILDLITVKSNSANVREYELIARNNMVRECKVIARTNMYYNLWLIQSALINGYEAIM